jgi:hypothetical protein
MEATMRVMRILRNLFRKSSIQIHKARMSSVFFAVEALLNGGRLNCAGLGRSARSRVKPKHNIKRIDRLLGNPKLHAELRLFFKAIARAAIGRSARPVILVDWTKVDYGKFSAVTAAVPVDGRSLPILWHVYEDSKWGSPEVHEHFLLTLKTMLPARCRPILVTDAGFHNPWFEWVRKLGWDWVGRISASKVRLPSGRRWLTGGEVLSMATRQPRDLGVCEVAKNNPMNHRVVLGKRYRPPPGGSSSRQRRRAITGLSVKKAKKRSVQPWLLATSMVDKSTAEVSGIYALRMRIEECYRDTKNHRFGWSFEDARATTAQRYAVLLLVSTLSMLALFLIGLVLEQQRRHYLFQANTVRHKRVLSLFFLGKQMIHRHEIKDVSLYELQKVLQHLTLDASGQLA